MSKPPLRPATPIDTELAQPDPDEDTEIGKANKLAEKYKKPPGPPDKETSQAMKQEEQQWPSMNSWRKGAKGAVRKR